MEALKKNLYEMSEPQVPNISDLRGRNQEDGRRYFTCICNFLLLYIKRYVKNMANGQPWYNMCYEYMDSFHKIFYYFCMFEIISILNKNKYNKYFFFMYIFLKRTLE